MSGRVPIVKAKVLRDSVRDRSEAVVVGFLRGQGFFGTDASMLVDIELTMLILAALLFTIGWRLAVGKHYRAHRWTQTAAATLNALVVLGSMVSSYLNYVLPGLPARLNQAYFAVPTVHAIVGLVAFLLGVFVVLRGNGLVPKALRFSNYKAFMRTSYALYMLATAIGVVVYLVWYGVL
jgi:uncharacterized membrane protein YozB (DUF420 family)